MAGSIAFKHTSGYQPGTIMPPMNSHVDLELFGVDKSFKYQTIRSQLLNVLRRKGVLYTLSDVGDIDKFIEIGLDSVPSIRVDHEKLFSIPESGDLNAVVESVYEYIKTFKMKSILVPVDFSEYAENAIKYAVALAAKLGLRVELMHVYHPVVDPHNAVILDADMGNILREQLTSLTERFSKEAEASEVGVAVDSRFEVGYPVQVITDVAKEDNVAFIVMGTLGATNVVDKMLGSNSSAVAMKVRKPVLLVPHDVTFTSISEIVVGFDKTLLTSTAFEKLTAFNEPFEAHIDFVHVEDGEDNNFSEIRDELVKRVLGEGSPSFSFDVHEISDKGLGKADALQQYVEENEPDLLVVVTEHRNFIERLFHSSISRKICLNPHGVILVLHKN